MSLVKGKLKPQLKAVASLGEDAEQRFSYAPGDNLTWYDYLGKYFGHFTESSIFLWHMTQLFTSMFLLKGKEGMHLYKNLYLIVHRSFICNSHNLKTTQINVRQWENGLKIKERKWINAIEWTKLTIIMLNKRSKTKGIQTVWIHLYKIM